MNHTEIERDIPAETRELVLERDHHQCQVCGTMNSLQLHHWKHFRSLGGDHSASNLVTVCANDHRRIHNREISIELHEVLGRYYAFVKREHNAFN